MYLYRKRHARRQHCRWQWSVRPVNTWRRLDNDLLDIYGCLTVITGDTAPKFLVVLLRFSFQNSGTNTVEIKAEYRQRALSICVSIFEHERVMKESIWTLFKVCSTGLWLCV